MRYNNNMTTTDITNVLEHIEDLQAPVEKWEVDTGTDSTGEDAVWVLAIVDDAKLDELPQPVRIRMRERIRSAINHSPACSDLMVYIRFRAASEA